MEREAGLLSLDTYCSIDFFEYVLITCARDDRNEFSFYEQSNLLFDIFTPIYQALPTEFQVYIAQRVYGFFHEFGMRQLIFLRDEYRILELETLTKGLHNIAWNNGTAFPSEYLNARVDPFFYDKKFNSIALCFNSDVRIDVYTIMLFSQHFEKAPLLSDEKGLFS